MKVKNLLIISFALLISLSFAVGVDGQKKRVSTAKKATSGAKGTLSVEAGLVF